MRKKTVLKLLGLLTVLVFIICNQKRVIGIKDKLKQNGSLSTGWITDLNLRPKSGNSIDVSFTYSDKGKTRTGESLIMGIFYRNFMYDFKGKSFPVIYIPDDISNSEILITPDRFDRFGIPFPDSLQWVRKFWQEDYKRFD